VHTDPAPLPDGSAAPAYLGSNQSGMRAHNERLVLSLIRRRGPLAKAEIARITGLSAQTVSVIMRALEADGLLIKGKPIRGKVGQPSVPMALAADGAYFFGLKIGRRSMELAVVDFLGKVIGRRRRTYNFPTPEAAIAFVHEAIADLTGGLPRNARDRIAGMGIAMPFFLWNWAQILGVPEARMAAWRTVDIRAEIAARYVFPVLMENDASAACGAEVVFGPAEAPRDFLYIFIGFFVGGGVVLNGALYTGPSGNAGALGPLPVPGPSGDTRQLIDVASLSGLETRLAAKGIDTASMWTSAENWRLDDAVLQSWIDEAAVGLAHAIVSACAIIDFKAVLIDGWIPADLRSRLVAAVAAQIDRQDMTGLRTPEIRPGTIGPDARVLGAASLPLSERFLVDSAVFSKSA